MTKRTSVGLIVGLTAAGGALATLAFARPQAEARKPGPMAAAAHGDPARLPSTAGDKAPILEIIHCPLAFAGVHLLKDLPEHSQVAYHYCKPVNENVSQCVIYDGNGADARLIGVEYLVSDALYRKMPPEEKSYWHDHKYEVDSGLLKSLTQTGEQEKKTMAAVRPLWGKVFHTWATGKEYPNGPPRLFWAVTGEEPFVLGYRAFDRLPVAFETAARVKLPSWMASRPPMRNSSS